MYPSLVLLALLTLGCNLLSTYAQTNDGPKDRRLQTAIELDVPTNGISFTPDGRAFVLLARADGSTGPVLVEYNLTTREMIPYPNEEWNAGYTPGSDPAARFIRLNAQRIGPDGQLYLVDVGSPAFGAAVVLPDGPKIIVVNVTTNEVSRVINMGNSTRIDSLLDDIRFLPTTGMAYLTDAGDPGLIVMEMESGIARRVMDAIPGITQGVQPMSYEGRILVSAQTGLPQYFHCDHHEVSPDGRYLYFQPANGGLNRIETRYLDQAFYNSSLTGAPLAAYVEPFAVTPPTGGTAIDANGTIYLSDGDSSRILAIAPDGQKTVLVSDPRLLWVDAMWIDADGLLWMPASQLLRGIPFGNGQSNITLPINVFTIDIGISPSAIDHA